MHAHRLLISFALITAATGLAAEKAVSALASEIWENHCAKCHGEDGKGQTKVGKKLKAKDYTDAKFQASITDKEMEKAIADGVFDQAGKEKMKAFKGELSSAEINDLVAHIRHMKK